LDAASRLRIISPRLISGICPTPVFADDRPTRDLASESGAESLGAVHDGNSLTLASATRRRASLRQSFVFVGASHAEAGVATQRVVERLDVAEDGESCLVSCPPASLFDELGLDGGYEALCQRVVEGVTAAAHARDQAGVAKRGAECKRGVLAASI
jgi:hypothetical protein